MTNLILIKSQDMVLNGNNVYKQSSQLTYTYLSMDLKYLKDIVYHNSCYKTLPNQICRRIIDLKINKKRRRGCRAGARSRKQQNPRYANLLNLINIKTSTKRVSNYLDVKIATANVQSIRNKDLILHQHIGDNEIDLCVLTETWLGNKQNDNIWKSCTPLNNDTFRISISNRMGQSGGGLALVYNKVIKVTKISEQNRQTFQYAIWETTTDKFNATIIGIYHPPYPATNKITNTQFIDEFLNWLPDQIMEHKNIIITGDINLHLNNIDDVDGSMLLDNLEVLGLESHCRFATHRMGNSLDVFFTEIASDITICSCTPGPFILDHCMVKCTTLMP